MLRMLTTIFVLIGYLAIPMLAYGQHDDPHILISTTPLSIKLN
jgi:hypothetical protein